MQPGFRRAASLGTVVILAVTAYAVGDELHRDYRFKVGHRPSVSIVNQYGPISVKPANGHHVIVSAILHSDKVEVFQSQSGNRISISSHLLPGSDAESGRVDYEVLVPADASVTLHSATGPLHAERLHGDVILEGNTGRVDVSDVSEGHVHVRTMDGLVTLTNITDGHVEITSVSGNVALKTVTGPFIQVNSSSGKILYDGDFGSGGQYELTSHTGDIEATAPSYASIDVTARSEQGKVESDFALSPSYTSFAVRAGSAFAGTMGKAASSVKLFSFSGRIHLRKR